MLLSIVLISSFILNTAHCQMFAIDKDSQNLNCLTGHKILTRSPSLQQQKQQSVSIFKPSSLPLYKLEYKCLCPNNYYGYLCSYHIQLDCFLDKLANKEVEVKEGNTEQEEDQSKYPSFLKQINFTARCWVVKPKKYSVDQQRVELGKFLSQNNSDNAYGVRQQFGSDVDIIWANDTSLFDLKTGRVKIGVQLQQQLDIIEKQMVEQDKSQTQATDIVKDEEEEEEEEEEYTPIQDEDEKEDEKGSKVDDKQSDPPTPTPTPTPIPFSKQLHQEDLSEQDIRKIFIKANQAQKLYQKPFIYESQFLGYGQINGNIVMQILHIDPYKGAKRLKSITEFEVLGLDDYIKSSKKMNNDLLSLGKNYVNVFNQQQQDLKQLLLDIQNGNNPFQQYLKQRSQRYNDMLPFSNKQTNLQLPTIKAQVNLNVQQLDTSYSGIHLQIDIVQKYQRSLTHRVGINGLSYFLQGKSTNQPQSTKRIIVTDHSFKSYYKILAVVLCIAFAYAVWTLINKWWQKKKLAQREGDDLVQDQSSISVMNNLKF